MALLLGSFMEGMRAQADFESMQQERQVRLDNERALAQERQQILARQSSYAEAYRKAAENGPKLDPSETNIETLLENSSAIDLLASKYMQASGLTDEAIKVQQQGEKSALEVMKIHTQTLQDTGAILKDVDFQDPKSWQAALSALASDDRTKEFLRKSTLQLANNGVDIRDSSNPMVRNWAHMVTGNINQKEKEQEAKQKAQEAKDKLASQERMKELEVQGRILSATIQANARIMAKEIGSDKAQNRADKAEKAKQDLETKISDEYVKDADRFNEHLDAERDRIRAKYSNDEDKQKEELAAFEKDAQRRVENFKNSWKPQLDRIGYNYVGTKLDTRQPNTSNTSREEDLRKKYGL